MAKRKIAARKPAAKRTPNLAAGRPRTDPVSTIRELAWTGQHAKAIELCTQTLAAKGMGDPSNAAARMDLLDLRTESYIALGQLEHAARDATEMVQMAGRGQSPALEAQSLNRKAVVQMRLGDLKPALDTAIAAEKAARQSKQTLLHAESLLRLGEAQVRAGNHEAGVKVGRQAIALFEDLGDSSGAGRAQWVAAFANQRLGRVGASRPAAQKALALCEQAGDRYGIGNALTILSQSDTDIVENIRHRHRATQAFEMAGYAERRTVSLGNLANVYLELGLYHHARRLLAETIAANRDMGARLSLTYALGNLANAETNLGALDDARLTLRELAGLVALLGDPNMDAALGQTRGELALAEGDAAAAVRHFASAAQVAHQAGLGFETVLQTQLGQARLTARDPTAALEATTKATAMHRGQSFARPDAFSSQEIWWRHAQALSANRKTKEARQALGRAYGFLLERISNLRDEGLRRTYLNKVG
jgi:tetratricopeptide (TPR) repeat protein